MNSDDLNDKVQRIHEFINLIKDNIKKEKDTSESFKDL